MSTENTPHASPRFNVESWIQRSNTGDVAHIEINHDTNAEKRWIKEYAAGRKDLRDTAIDHSRHFIESGRPAEAVISSRIALEIPWQGGEFMFNRGVVVEVMGMDGYVNERTGKELHPKDSYQDIKAWSDFHVKDEAMQEAFDTPYEVKTELREIAVRGREAISGREINAWLSAIDYFGERGEIHAAGVGSLELGAAYERDNQFDSALEAYKAASELLKHRLQIITNEENIVSHAAAIHELTDQLISALSSVVKLYADIGSVRSDDKELVKAAVYQLDDLGAPAVTVREGYKFLSTNARFREKHFYKKEVAGIAGVLIVRKFFEENPGSCLVCGPGPHKDRRNRRPPIADRK